MKFQVHRLDARLLSASPQVDKIKAADDPVEGACTGD